MMTLLVTGGAGYIGSEVARQLVAAGHRVVVYDNLSHGHRAAVPTAAEMCVGDVLDRARLDEVLANWNFDAVLHFAALIEAGESMRVPEVYFRNNAAGTLTLLEAMLGRGVKRLVFSSTAALYGNPVRTPIEESDPLAPTNAYGASKLMVEQMLEWMQGIHGLRYASLRYFNAAGAVEGHGEDHQPESHLIPLTLSVALGKRPQVAIFGDDYPTRDGTCVRDYVHVADLAAAHLLALDALDARQRMIYNLGSGQGFTVRELLEVARDVTGHAIPAIVAPRRAGDPAVLVASAEKIARELGWAPRISHLTDIVRGAWRWYQIHPDGYAEPTASKSPTV